jgi:hypothetical protein
MYATVLGSQSLPSDTGSHAGAVRGGYPREHERRWRPAGDAGLANRQIRVLRSADNTGHSGRIALDSVANAPGVFNSVGWVAGAGQPGQNDPAELFVVVLGVLDRWRLPDRAERGPNLAQDQRSEAVGNLLGHTERGRGRVRRDRVPVGSQLG